MLTEFGLHDTVMMKKPHACGENRWQIIRVGSKSDEATKAIREQLKLAPVPDYWPQKLLLKDIPYTDNWRIEDVDTTVPFVNATPPPVPKS